VEISGSFGMILVLSFAFIKLFGLI